jgi:hypothetical protein
MFLTAAAPAPDTTLVRVIAGVLAVVIIAIIVMRRKGKKKNANDEF